MEGGRSGIGDLDRSRLAHEVAQGTPGSLSSAALVVLKRADGLRARGRGLVFPGIQGKMVGAAVFGRLLNDLKIDCSPHGFRSSFRSWCSDEGIDREVAEQAMAHAVGSQVEQRYARSDVLERRREVMQAWGAFLVQQVQGRPQEATTRPEAAEGGG